MVSRWSSSMLILPQASGEASNTMLQESTGSAITLVSTASPEVPKK